MYQTLLAAQIVFPVNSFTTISIINIEDENFIT